MCSISLPNAMIQEFVRAYAVKLGALLDGWWFDGCYEWEPFHNSLYDWPAWFAAARAGNPEAIVAFNDGAFCIGKLKPVTPLEDYHAGEVHMLRDGKIKLGHDHDSPLYMPSSRFIDGVQWHALLPVDSTFEGGEPYHYSDQQRTMEATCTRFNAANLRWRDGRALRISVAAPD